MDPLWVVPILVLVFGGAAMVALLRGTRDSARELADEVARFGELHVALARVRSGLQEGATTLQERRNR